MKTIRLEIPAFFLFMFISISTLAQNYEKVWFNKSDSTYGYYIVLKPADAAFRGAIVLLDGYGGNATSMLHETHIPQKALSNSLIVVCIPSGPRLFLDKEYASTINRILTEVSAHYKIDRNKFAIGGFSIGGTIALRYTELSYQYPHKFYIEPKALFTIDSPVDLLRLHESSQKELKSVGRSWWGAEARMIIDSLDRNIGKLPLGLQSYKEKSPFFVTDSLPGNERWIVNVPYRTYHDVDIEWQLINRKRSIYELNMLNASELINRLLNLGSTHAEFIASKVHGRRANGQMNPHSWNIVDEADLILWINKALIF